MSKELINEIESKIAWNDKSIDETSISLKDVKRLLNELEEQAECVQELREQNKRYRKAINKIIEKAMLFGTNEEVYDAIQDAIKALEVEKHD